MDGWGSKARRAATECQGRQGDETGGGQEATVEDPKVSHIGRARRDVKLEPEEEEG